MKKQIPTNTDDIRQVSNASVQASVTPSSAKDWQLYYSSAVVL